MGNILVGMVVTDKFGFTFQSILKTLPTVDVLLALVDDTNESELEQANVSSEYIKGVGASIHEVEFGEDAYGSSTLRVNAASKFEGI